MKHVTCGKFFFDATDVTTINAAKKGAEELCKIVKDKRENDENFVRIKVIQKLDHFIVDLKLTD